MPACARRRYSSCGKANLITTMTRMLSEDQVRLLRLHAQRLLPQSTDACATVSQVAKAICGVQAQDESASALALRVRGTKLKASDVEHARVRERSVVRTWCMRGTLHLLAAEDVGWLLSLHGPVFIAKSRRRYQQLGLDDDICARGIRVLREVLSAKNPRTRPQIVEILATRNVHLSGQAGYHLLRRAALEGVVCFGPDLDNKPTYVPLDKWAKKGRCLKREVALSELARRYLEAYGPAGLEDLTTWSGLRLSDLRIGWQSIASEAIEVNIGKKPALMHKSHEAWLKETQARSQTPFVRLLPSFDTYLLGYRNRDLAVASQYAKRLHPGGGVLHPTLLVDGRAAGTWQTKKRRDQLNVVVQPFEKLTPSVKVELETEVADLGEFLGRKTTLVVQAPLAGSPAPLVGG